MRSILDYSMSNLYLHQVTSIVTTLTRICVTNKYYLTWCRQLEYPGLKDYPEFLSPDSWTVQNFGLPSKTWYQLYLYLDTWTWIFLNVNVPIHGPDGSNQSCTPILVDVEVQKDSLVACEQTSNEYYHSFVVRPDFDGRSTHSDLSTRPCSKFEPDESSC